MLYSIGFKKPALKSKLPLHTFTNSPPKLQSWFCKTNTIMHYYDFKKSIKGLDVSYLVRIYKKNIKTTALDHFEMFIQSAEIITSHAPKILNNLLFQDCYFSTYS